MAGAVSGLQGSKFRVSSAQLNEVYIKGSRLRVCKGKD